MFYVMRLISRIPKNEKAQALTEYGLIIALVAILLVGALVALRTDAVRRFLYGLAAKKNTK
jgi:pilus assembly protein Flp/PilA